MYATKATVANKAAEVIPAIPPAEIESSSTSDALESTLPLSIGVNVDGMSLGNEEGFSRLDTEVGRNVSAAVGELLTIIVEGEELEESCEGEIEGT